MNMMTPWQAGNPETDPLDALFDTMFQPMNAQGVYARTGVYEAVVEAMVALISSKREAGHRDLPLSAGDEPRRISSATAISTASPTCSAASPACDGTEMRNPAVGRPLRQGRRLDRKACRPPTSC